LVVNTLFFMVVVIDLQCCTFSNNYYLVKSKDFKELLLSESVKLEFVTVWTGSVTSVILGDLLFE